MPWIYERPNEYVVFSFVFYVKKVCQEYRTNFHITYYRDLVRVISKLFGPLTSICKSFLSWTPILCHINFLPNQREKIKQTQK